MQVVDETDEEINRVFKNLEPQSTKKAKKRTFSKGDQLVDKTEKEMEAKAMDPKEAKQTLDELEIDDRYRTQFHENPEKAAAYAAVGLAQISDQIYNELEDITPALRDIFINYLLTPLKDDPTIATILVQIVSKSKIFAKSWFVNEAFAINPKHTKLSDGAYQRAFINAITITREQEELRSIVEEMAGLNLSLQKANSRVNFLERSIEERNRREVIPEPSEKAATMAVFFPKPHILEIADFHGSEEEDKDDEVTEATTRLAIYAIEFFRVFDHKHLLESTLENTVCCVSEQPELQLYSYLIGNLMIALKDTKIQQTLCGMNENPLFGEYFRQIQDQKLMNCQAVAFRVMHESYIEDIAIQILIGILLSFDSPTNDRRVMYECVFESYPCYVFLLNESYNKNFFTPIGLLLSSIYSRKEEDEIPVQMLLWTPDELVRTELYQVLIYENKRIEFILDQTAKQYMSIMSRATLEMNSSIANIDQYIKVMGSFENTIQGLIDHCNSPSFEKLFVMSEHNSQVSEIESSTFKEELVHSLE